MPGIACKVLSKYKLFIYSETNIYRIVRSTVQKYTGIGIIKQVWIYSFD